ncbi:haloacid dehalogenase superfamily, subfamily IA, variant 3 with third motif having DD or ED [Acinetobacter marinus]|uniref:Haloacid dehalogenase superfamily, subfamily IA, variant 3 with third motif having DD or ED n=1 Tax=Acinetobacter marinus TaxID=281375 RepID=A0A1G6GKL2_9GAMM|nr:HAD family hydrolase [Acinetobacter marinus]SDB82285.1 haloacid dehalogenase superfamily, subfamily IA, variant 3 with third motif having DD or ED [Acinetobacter marinus]
MLNFHGNAILGAIFDMDGTMFDTERLRFQTLKQASKELIGEEFSDDYLMSCLGLSAKRAQELAEQIYGENVNYADIRKRADEFEIAHVRHHGVPMKSGLVEVLERLRRSGLRMAVATSSKRVIAEEYLINANVYKYFDVVVCGDDVEKGKPDPEIFLLAASRINIDPQHCLMFEDSDNGLKSAHQAGGHTVLFQDLKVPTAEMQDMAEFFYEEMPLFLNELNQHLDPQDMPQPMERFPASHNQHIVGIHGFGAIGGGYVAQIFSHWDGYTRPAKILATTSNALYKESIQAFGKYCIRYHQESYDETIDGIEIIDGHDDDAVIEMYEQSNIVALCLPEQAIEAVSPIIAKALLKRYESNAEPLTLMMILNKVGAKQFVMAHIETALDAITSKDVVQKIIQRNYFVDTVVNRMVSKFTDKALYRQLRIKYHLFQQYQSDRVDDDPVDIEDTTSLNSDQAKFMTNTIADLKENFQPSHVLQSMDLILFHSESDMPLYAEKGSPILEQLRQVITVDDIRQIQTVKNRLWNGVHSIIAWYGVLLGHDTIGIAMGDQRVLALAEQLVDHEVGLGLSHQYPNIVEILPQLKASFLKSCKYAYKDPCTRVGRDPIRKLQLNDRVFGSIQMNVEYGVSTEGLVYGATLALLYAQHAQSAEDEEAQQIKQALEQSPEINAEMLSKLLHHDRSELSISEAQYLDVMQHIAQHLQAAQQDVSAFLGDWQQCMQGIVEG